MMSMMRFSVSYLSEKACYVQKKSSYLAVTSANAGRTEKERAKRAAKVEVNLTMMLKLS